MATTPITTAFWNFTLNNPTPEEMTILEHVASEYLREIVWTPEKGKDGTPHLQGWIKLHRQQRLSFMKKFLNRAHWKPLTSAEYIFNAKHYAQKQDETSQGATIHRFYDALPSIENMIKRVAEKCCNADIEIVKNYCKHIRHTKTDRVAFMTLRREQERELVESDYRLAKILVSATYCKMWEEFGNAMLFNIYSHFQSESADDFADSEEEEELEIPTHTHTHTQSAHVADPRSFFSPERHNNATPSSPSTPPRGTQEEEDDETESNASDGGSGMGDDE